MGFAPESGLSEVPNDMIAFEAAQQAGDVDEGSLLLGQDAGLINDLPAAGDLIARMVAEAEEIMTARLPGLVRER